MHVYVKLSAVLLLVHFAESHKAAAHGVNQSKCCQKESGVPPLSLQRTLLTEKVKPEINIVQGRYKRDYLNVKSLSFKYKKAGIQWKSIQCTLYGAKQANAKFSQMKMISTWSKCRSTTTTPKFPYEGSYVFIIRGIPVHWLKPAVRAWSTWNIDYSRPETSILSTISNDNRKTNMTLTFLGTDNYKVNSFQCRVDKRFWKACDSPYTVEVPSNTREKHIFEVRAIDAAGNVDRAPASHEWTTISLKTLLLPGIGPQSPLNCTLQASTDDEEPDKGGFKSAINADIGIFAGLLVILVTNFL